MAESVTLTTSDGETLEAELALPDNAQAIVVITHPHPLMGGDMHTPVPDGFFRALEDTDSAALRFNFRGVGQSTGTHDKGGAERLDVAAAIEHAALAMPEMPIIIAGWSFGADVALTVEDERVVGWFLAAPPLSVVDPGEMSAAPCAAPKVLAIGENDQFNRPAKARVTVANWQNTQVTTIPGADHFFGPALPTLIAAFTTFVDSAVRS